MASIADDKISFYLSQGKSKLKFKFPMTIEHVPFGRFSSASITIRCVTPSVSDGGR